MRHVDMAPQLQRKAYISLADPLRFVQAQIVTGSVAWPGDIDIAPETLCRRSRPFMRGSRSDRCCQTNTSSLEPEPLHDPEALHH